MTHVFMWHTFEENNPAMIFT